MVMGQQVLMAAVLQYVIENTMQDLIFRSIGYECHMLYGVNVLLPNEDFSRL